MAAATATCLGPAARRRPIVRFELVQEHLASLPVPLPAPDDRLLPIVVGGVIGRLPEAPSLSRSGRPAGVLVLLYPDEEGAARVVLTERAARDGYHSGEVSFPGGRAESRDVDIVATAMREAAEEVALDVVAAGVRVVGFLESLLIPVSDFEVTPVLAIAQRRPVLNPAPSEVARIVEPGVDRFLPDAPMVMVERTVRGWPLRYGAYEVDGLFVWGATARILSQLGAVLAR